MQRSLFDIDTDTGTFGDTGGPIHDVTRVYEQIPKSAVESLLAAAGKKMTAQH